MRIFKLCTKKQENYVAIATGSAKLNMNCVENILICYFFKKTYFSRGKEIIWINKTTLSKGIGLNRVGNPQILNPGLCITVLESFAKIVCLICLTSSSNYYFFKK